MSSKKERIDKEFRCYENFQSLKSLKNDGSEKIPKELDF